MNLQVLVHFHTENSFLILCQTKFENNGKRQKKRKIPCKCRLNIIRLQLNYTNYFVANKPNTCIEGARIIIISIEFRIPGYKIQMNAHPSGLTRFTFPDWYN